MTARRADDDQLSPTRCTCHGTGNAVRFDRDSWKRREFEWYYHDDDVPGPRAAIDLSIAGLPANLTRAKLTHHRVDQDPQQRVHPMEGARFTDGRHAAAIRTQASSRASRTAAQT
jgi:hypothetical protein